MGLERVQKSELEKSNFSCKACTKPNRILKLMQLFACIGLDNSVPLRFYCFKNVLGSAVVNWKEFC